MENYCTKNIEEEDSILKKTLNILNSKVDEYINKNNIIPTNKALFKNKCNISPNILTNGGGFYFYFLFLKSEVIIFEFGLNLDIISIRKYDKEHYDSFYIKKESVNSIILKFKNSNKDNSIYSNVYTLYKNLLKDDKDFKNFSKFLLSQNFIENSNLKSNKQTGYKFWYIINIIFAIIILIGITRCMYSYFK